MAEYPLVPPDDPRVAPAVAMVRKCMFMGGNYTLNIRRILAAIDAEVPNTALDAEAAIGRVREVHRRVSNVCAHCSERDYPNYEASWPCPTIQALDPPAPDAKP